MIDDDRSIRAIAAHVVGLVARTGRSLIAFDQAPRPPIGGGIMKRGARIRRRQARPATVQLLFVLLTRKPALINLAHSTSIFPSTAAPERTSREVRVAPQADSCPAANRLSS